MSKKKVIDENTYEMSEELHLAHQKALFSMLVEFDRVCRVLDVPYILFAGTMLGAVRHQGFIPWDDDLDVLMMRKDYERFLREADLLLDQEKFYLQKEFSGHWPMFFSKLRMNNTTCLEKYHPKDPETHQGVYIDLFPCDNAFNSSLGRKIQFYASKVVIAKSLWKRGYETFSRKKRIFMNVCRLLPGRPFLKLVRGGGGKSLYVHTFLGAASNYSKNVYKRRHIEERTMGVFEGRDFPISKHYDELFRIIYGDYMRLPDVKEREMKKHAVWVDLNNSYELYREYHHKLSYDVLTKSIR